VPVELLYFDNLDIGATFRAGPVEMTAAEIKAFASRFDPQPFHTDESAAEHSFFRGLAASGWHTAAVTMAMLVEALPVSGGLIGAGLEELRWPQPTRPGDQLSIVVEVVERRMMKSRADLGLVKLRCVTSNQKDKAVQVSVTTILAPVRAG
jgi:acyl dehydratase